MTVIAAGPFLNPLTGEFLSLTAHLGRLLAMLESAEGGCGSSASAFW